MPSMPREREKQVKWKRKYYSLTGRIHQIEFTTMVHHLRSNGILPELMYERCDLRVKHEAFCSAAPTSNTANIDAVDDNGWAWDGTRRRLFVEGGVGGNVVVDYPITICLGGRKLGRVRTCKEARERRWDDVLKMKKIYTPRWKLREQE